MKKVLFVIGLVGILALMVGPFNAIAGGIGNPAGTLYQQEGTDADGPSAINAAGQGPGGDSANWTNWKYQEGSASWSGVYAGNNGWLWVNEGETDFHSIDVEADIEMYYTGTISNNNIYFHLGNIYTATAADKTAYVNGSFSCNNGQYIGIYFPDKTAADFEESGGALTGKIIGGMKSDRDTFRSQASLNHQMDIEFLLSWGAGWRTPSNFGDGSAGTQTNGLWWLVNDGVPGSYSYQWRVRIFPEAHQPDGDYYLDPVVMVTPYI